MKNMALYLEVGYIEILNSILFYLWTIRVI